MSYKIPKHHLPTALQHYAEGTGDFPAGSFTMEQEKSAMKYRQTFFRRLQAYKPGIQYQWPDYCILMWQEILSYAKRVLRDGVMDMWNQLTGHNSKLGAIYASERRRRFHNSGPMSLARRERLEREVRNTTFILDIQDPRTLGLMEEAVVGKAFYGIPSCTGHIAW
jgi:hypothetical protein